MLKKDGIRNLDEGTRACAYIFVAAVANPIIFNSHTSECRISLQSVMRIFSPTTYTYTCRVRNIALGAFEYIYLQWNLYKNLCTYLQSCSEKYTGRISREAVRLQSNDDHWHLRIDFKKSTKYVFFLKIIEREIDSCCILFQQDEQNLVIGGKCLLNGRRNDQYHDHQNIFKSRLVQDSSGKYIDDSTHFEANYESHSFPRLRLDQQQNVKRKRCIVAPKS